MPGYPRVEKNDGGWKEINTKKNVGFRVFGDVPIRSLDASVKMSKQVKGATQS